MPIAGAKINDRCYDRDYILGVAGETGSWGDYPYPLIKSALEDRDRDEVHVSVTEITGGAWRRVVLEHLFDYYVDLDQAVARVLGTWMHEGYASQFDNTLVVLEQRLGGFVGVGDPLFITGQIDCYLPAQRRLIDLKTTGRMPPEPYDSQLQQLAAYVSLLDRHCYVVDSACIHYIQRDGKGLRVYELDVEGEHDWVWDVARTDDMLYAGAKVIYAGINDGAIPPLEQCKEQFCPFCDVRTICEEVG